MVHAMRFGLMNLLLVKQEVNSRYVESRMSAPDVLTGVLVSGTLGSPVLLLDEMCSTNLTDLNET